MDTRAKACKRSRLPSGCCVRWSLLRRTNEGYGLAVGGQSQPPKGDRIPKKGQELVRIPLHLEDDEEVAADLMLSVCVVPAGTSFLNEDDAVQAVKTMKEGHEDKGVGKEDCDNDEVTEDTKDKEKKG